MSAIVAVAVAVAVYYARPPSWIKVIWGLLLVAAAYLVLTVVRTVSGPDNSATFRRPSSPSWVTRTGI